MNAWPAVTYRPGGYERSHKMKLNELKMLERVRAGLSDDANLTPDEKEITHALYVRGYLGACPVEGSDAQVDALWITPAGIEALGELSIQLVTELKVQNRYFYSQQLPHKAFTQGVTGADKRVAYLFDALTDDARMRADLLQREIEKNVLYANTIGEKVNWPSR
jgi:hypothetical protein